ncbi:hypothetical protein ARZXY2_3026 [Arthrobacter sp. ZXY-2]|nr:hypothetical protein ARZXY2_3026 [Arthrobacter sp. ZXY-2]
MTLTRRSQRTVKVYPQPRHRRQHTGITKLPRKHRPRPHRTHRMRTRRTNTHGEQIENTNSHNRDPFVYSMKRSGR